jgi:hypothetical protein
MSDSISTTADIRDMLVVRGGYGEAAHRWGPLGGASV